MAFAVFYNREDITRIVAEFQRTDIPSGDRNFAASVWNAGLNTWSSAPPDPRPEEPQPNDALIVVVDGKHQGQTITLQQFRDFLFKWGQTPGSEYLLAIYDDLSRKSGAEEPWPRP
jgi:hypothetical protein